MSAGPVTISNSSSGSVYVYGLGALLVGDTVRSGLLGPPLTVSSTNPVTLQVTLANATGASVTIAAGTRLIDMTDRPTAYADELGVYAIGSTIYGDSSGHATAYLDVAACDYVIAGGPPVPDIHTQATLAGSDDNLTWTHDVSGDDRAVIVAISWQQSTSSETLDSVKYDGEEMTRLASNGIVDLFVRVNPPTGSKTIEATWSGSGPKGVVAVAQGFTGVDQAQGFGIPRIDSNTGTSATVVVKNTNGNGLVLGVLAVNTVPGTTTATAVTGSIELWNLSAGTVLATTRTLGAGETRMSDLGNVTPTWAVSPSRPWATIGAEILPVGMRLYADQTGTACPARGFGINAEFYATLQQAIDALPSKGGVLYVPAGTYRLRTGLIIDKPNVTLIGEGLTTLITSDDPVNLPIDLLTISADQTRISNIKFDAGGSSIDLEDGVCCIVINGVGVSGRIVPLCILENLTLTGASRYGLWLKDTILFTAINCNVLENPGTGIRIQGTVTELGASTTIRIYSCNISYNGSIGADIGDNVQGAGTVAIAFFGSTFEGNQGHGFESLANVGTGVTAQSVVGLQLLSCYFEIAPEETSQFVHLGSCLAATVDSCLFEGGGVEAHQPERAVKFVNSAFSRFTSNSAEGMKSEIVFFGVDCDGSVEFGNRDMNPSDGYARITIDSLAFGVIGMSRGAVGLPTHVGDSALPVAATNPEPGSMAWVSDPDSGNSNLRVWDGSDWRNIAFT